MTFERSFRKWAATQAPGLHAITNYTGTAENWLRGQAILAAEAGAFGPFDALTAETGTGRTDLCLWRATRCCVRVELKLVFNNKNLRSHRNGTAAVALDLEKLAAVEAERKYVAVWCVFRDRWAIECGPAYYSRTQGLALQMPAEGSHEQFRVFARQLASTALGEVLDRVPKPDEHDVGVGRWSGLYLQRVA